MGTCLPNSGDSGDLSRPAFRSSYIFALATYSALRAFRSETYYDLYTTHLIVTTHEDSVGVPSELAQDDRRAPSGSATPMDVAVDDKSKAPYRPCSTGRGWRRVGLQNGIPVTMAIL